MNNQIDMSELLKKIHVPAPPIVERGTGMTLSKLIERLQEIQDEFGDMPVYSIDTETGGAEDVRDVLIEDRRGHVCAAIYGEYY